MSNDEIEGQDEEEAEWRANSQTYEQSCGWRIRMVTMMMRRRRRIVLRCASGEMQIQVLK